MNEELNTQNAKLLNELAAAQFVKIQALKIAALEHALLKNNLPLYREYESKFNSIREADQGLKELAATIQQVQKSMNP